jgi:hypothetical protein
VYPPVPVVFALAQNFFCARAPGAAATRPSLRPLFLTRASTWQSSGEFRRENENVCLSSVIAYEAATDPVASSRLRGEVKGGDGTGLATFVHQFWYPFQAIDPREPHNRSKPNES